MNKALEFIVGFGDMLFGRDKEEREQQEEQKAEYIQQARQIKFQYRPQTFDEYISQDKAKEKCKLTIGLIIRGFPRNFLFTGNAGCGKSSLAGIIAHELGFEFNMYVGSNFDIQTFNDFLRKNETTEKPNILFIDETAEVDKKTLTYMLPVIEDYKINGVDVRKFILIGATTDTYVLAKRCQPFLDRIQCKCQLEDYSVDDIILLIKQYNRQIHKANISEEEYEIIARNTRYTPRIAISYIDWLVACGSVEKVLKMNRIIKDGLDDIDIRVLDFLLTTGKPVGEEAVSIIANMTRTEYKELREPYLLRSGLLSRTNRGRIITNKGTELLQSIKR
jgi:Holliday junction DNA helicase RuvB